MASQTGVAGGHVKHGLFLSAANKPHTHGEAPRFALIRMRLKQETNPDEGSIADGAVIVPATYSGVGAEPIARYLGWIAMLRNDRPAADKAGGQILAFLAGTAESRYNHAFRSLLRAEAHTFRQERASAVAAAHEAAHSLGNGTIDARAMEPMIAAVLAWNGEGDDAVQMLSDLATGTPAIAPGMITRDALFTTPLAGHQGFQDLVARLDAMMAAIDLGSDL